MKEVEEDCNKKKEGFREQIQKFQRYVSEHSEEVIKLHDEIHSLTVHRDMYQKMYDDTKQELEISDKLRKERNDELRVYKELHDRKHKLLYDLCSQYTQHSRWHCDGCKSSAEYGQKVLAVFKNLP